MGERTGTNAAGAVAIAALFGFGTAAAVRYGLDEQVNLAAVAGGGVGVLVLLALLVRRGRGPRPATGGRFVEQVRPVELIAPPETAGWLHRAQAAAERLEGHRAACAQEDGPGAHSPVLLQVLTDAAVQARTAAEQLSSRAAAVAVIDNATATGDPRELRADQVRLTREAELLPDGPLRQAKESSAQAVADRAAALTRLEDLRQLLLATLESLALRLEALAEHGGMLLSVQVASDAAASSLDLSPLTNELVAVQSGLDQLEELTRDMASGSTDPLALAEASAHAGPAAVQTAPAPRPEPAAPAVPARDTEPAGPARAMRPGGGSEKAEEKPAPAQAAAEPEPPATPAERTTPASPPDQS